MERCASQIEGVPRSVAIAAAATEIGALRTRILAGEAVDGEAKSLLANIRDLANLIADGPLRPLINATGVVLHTNLGRAPLPSQAAAAAALIASGYSNLEYDLDTGKRGSRHTHLEPLLCELSGAEAAIAVNNNAAAVLLALAAHAPNGEVIVSRGQLIEIGDSFRIPEILAQSGAHLVEVGTTNRTRIPDYEDAISPATRAILRVHQSNFRTVGFAEDVGVRALAELAHRRGLPLIEDLGSGALTEIADEPVLRQSIAAGVDLACCSADKLLGGPQAGILVGKRTVIEHCRRHPLARALRLDKLQIAALEATLRLQRDHGTTSIPALSMLSEDKDVLLERAQQMVEVIGARARLDETTGFAGGGTMPLTELAGPACFVDPGNPGPDEMLRRLRLASTPVISRIVGNKIVLDPRTMSNEESEVAAQITRVALGQ